MKLPDGYLMCDVDGCVSTNKFSDIYEWHIYDDIHHLCEWHLEAQPKTPPTKIYKKQKVYGRDSKWK